MTDITNENNDTDTAEPREAQIDESTSTPNSADKIKRAKENVSTYSLFGIVVGGISSVIISFLLFVGYEGAVATWVATVFAVLTWIMATTSMVFASANNNRLQKDRDLGLPIRQVGLKADDFIFVCGICAVLIGATVGIVSAIAS